MIELGVFVCVFFFVARVFYSIGPARRIILHPTAATTSPVPAAAEPPAQESSPPKEDEVEISQEVLRRMSVSSRLHQGYPVEVWEDGEWHWVGPEASLYTLMQVSFPLQAM